MKNANHESYPIAMQNLVSLMDKAGYKVQDDIITAWEFNDRFVFITEEDIDGGQFSLDEFYITQMDFGTEPLELGSLSECWAKLAQLQEEGRATRGTKVVLQVEIQNDGWQTLVDNVNQEQQDHFNAQETDRDGVITKHGMRYRLVTVSK